jgi:NMD protein affecting ribosome stability and mRNA decay
MVKTLQGRPPHYFEATIQLRDLPPGEVQQVVEFIENSGRAAISKIKDYDNGVDIYISDRHFAHIIARWMKETFNGELMETRRLHSLDRQTMKAKWRVTVLFRGLPFKVNDAIETEDGPVKILSMKKQAHVKYLKTGKTRTIPFDVLARYVKK